MKVRKGFLGALVSLGLMAAGAGFGGITALATEADEAVAASDFTIYNTTQGVIADGVSYNGVSLAGMTLDEAKAAVQEYASSVESRYIRFMVLEQQFDYNGQNFGTTWTNPEVVDQLNDCLVEGNIIDQYKKQKDYQQNPLNLQLEFTINEDQVRATVQDYIANFTKTAQNATISRLTGDWVITEATTGYSFDEETIVSQLLALMEDYTTADDIIYDFPHETTYAQYDSSYFNFSSTPLGSYTTDKLDGGGARKANIALSASNMNGSVFYPGETASALDMYGSITIEGGYGKAPGYENGKEVEAIGGGICQTTTTLYNAVLRAELQVSYRRAHSMMVSYVPPSMDATVDGASGSDFTFVNSTNYPIYIEAYVEGDTVTINIWGVDERAADRVVSFRTDVLSIEWIEPYFTVTNDDTQCALGAINYVGDKSKSLTNPHPAVHSKSYKVVTENGQTTETLVNEDYYKGNVGTIIKASDCLVEISEPTPSDSPNAVFPYIGWTISTRTTTLSGEDWPDPEALLQKQAAAATAAETEADTAASETSADTAAETSADAAADTAADTTADTAAAQ